MLPSGLDDVVVVDSVDAVLIAAKSRLQDVKVLFKRLKAEGHLAHDIHRTVHRTSMGFLYRAGGRRVLQDQADRSEARSKP